MTTPQVPTTAASTGSITRSQGVSMPDLPCNGYCFGRPGLEQGNVGSAAAPP